MKCPLDIANQLFNIMCKRILQSTRRQSDGLLHILKCVSKRITAIIKWDNKTLIVGWILLHRHWQMIYRNCFARPNWVSYAAVEVANSYFHSKINLQRIIYVMTNHDYGKCLDKLQRVPLFFWWGILFWGKSKWI